MEQIWTILATGLVTVIATVITTLVTRRIAVADEGRAFRRNSERQDLLDRRAGMKATTVEVAVLARHLNGLVHQRFNDKRLLLDGHFHPRDEKSARMRLEEAKGAIALASSQLETAYAMLRLTAPEPVYLAVNGLLHTLSALEFPIRHPETLTAFEGDIEHFYSVVREELGVDTTSTMKEM
ncbi:hypothetical protein [Rathayibacter sp. Leaf248]|uniref:hypothetical protein n=1 Tax=Rathayibacter sp. Leaf248 TaxID=2876555 RepID=UPI001E62356B|nr:hypothetical protein [Rathayibacter sp. Leaf248]